MQSKWMTATKIAERLGYTIEAVDASLRRYEREGLVVRRSRRRTLRDRSTLEWRFK